MNKPILYSIISLTLTMPVQAANWMPIETGDPTNHVYYDADAIDEQGYDRTLKVLSDGELEPSVKSTITDLQIDCRLGNYTVLRTDAYSEPMGKGVVTHLVTTPVKMTFIMPGTLQFKLKKKVCQ